MTETDNGGTDDLDPGKALELDAAPGPRLGIKDDPDIAKPGPGDDNFVEAGADYATGGTP